MNLSILFTNCILVNFNAENMYNGDSSSISKENWSSNEVLPEMEYEKNAYWVAKVQDKLYQDTRECQVSIHALENENVT